MTQTTARIKKAGKHFEILVNMEDALKFKKGEIGSIEAEGDIIFRDVRKAERAPSSDLNEAFGTTETNKIVQEIVKKGEILVTQKQRNAEQEKRYNQIVDFLAVNSIDSRTGKPHPSERIKNALEQAHVNIKNVPVENQINEIIQEISKILPIRLEMKSVKITIPAMHTGKAYGVVAQYKKEESWLDDGSLRVVVSVPSGIVMDFYDKLNSITHGSALTEEIKE
ncbi:MAG: ribosome maturation protein SDO1 [archaeon GW2011_AR19]|nr:MAG: ribosome maturation protein SDO1 [archaeon GW2011_AR19]